MGLFWSQTSSIVESDESEIDCKAWYESSESSDEEYCSRGDPKNTSLKKNKKGKEGPSDGWEEICGIAIDILQDISTVKKNKIRQRGDYVNEKEIPTIDENRTRLKSAYELWLKYHPKDSKVFVPRWEGILERPIFEQFVLVNDYVRNVYMLLQLEELKDFEIPKHVPKGTVLVRNPNKPGTFITLDEGLKQKEMYTNLARTNGQRDISQNSSSSNLIGSINSSNP